MGILKKLFGGGGAGEPPEFTAFVEQSLEGLKLQTSAHQAAWHLGESERWDIDQAVGDLVFTFPDMTATAPAQIIGSFDSKSGTWMWAWANTSVVDALKRDSLRVRAYGEKHGIARLTTPKWPAEETDAWRMTALACRLCEASGAYRGPAGTTFVFMTFGEIKLEKKR